MSSSGQTIASSNFQYVGQPVAPSSARPAYPSPVAYQSATTPGNPAVLPSYSQATGQQSGYQVTPPSYFQQAPSQQYPQQYQQQMAQQSAASSYQPQAGIPPLQMDQTLAMFKAFAQKMGIKNDFAAKLRKVGDFKIVVLNDDSGSMNSNAYTGEFVKDPYAPMPSRFDELKRMNQTILDMACILSKEPVDVFFLNREGKQNVKNFAEIEPYFAKRPTEHDLTPTVRALQNIIAQHQKTLSEKNLLIFIATDGQGTDANGQVNIPEMDNYLRQIHESYRNLYITFCACVSDESLLKIMDKWGREMPRIGVVDQYVVEYKEMMEKHGKNPEFSFTQGDYVTKALLVSIDPDIKQLFRDDDDEARA